MPEGSREIPTAERLRDIAASIGLELAPWQVDCALVILQGGQWETSRRTGMSTPRRAVEEYLRVTAGERAARSAAERRAQTLREVIAAFEVDPVVVGAAESAPTGNRESDLLATIDQLERDEIDDLVDMQLRQERTGFDHSINQPKCIHCRGEAHSVPRTERMQEMRSLFRSTVEYFEDGPRASDEVVAQLDAYRYNEDTSEIVCPGSEFVGPPKPRGRLFGLELPADPLDSSAWLPNLGTCTCGWCRASRAAIGIPEIARPASRVTDWFASVSTLSTQLDFHLFRNSSVVLLPDQLPALEAVLGMQVRHVPGLRSGYVACEYEATRDGLASAMCDYLTLDRAGTSPVVVASPDFLQTALRMTEVFLEPWRPTDRASLSTQMRRFTELGNMRVDPMPVSAVYVGFRTDAPSAAEVSRLIQAQQPPATPWTLDRITQLREWPNPFLPTVIGGFTFTGLSDGPGVQLRPPPAPAEPDPVPPEEPQEHRSRRERRGQQARAVPMWVPRFDGRNRRGRRT